MKFANPSYLQTYVFVLPPYIDQRISKIDRKLTVVSTYIQCTMFALMEVSAKATHLLILPRGLTGFSSVLQIVSFHFTSNMIIQTDRYSDDDPPLVGNIRSVEGRYLHSTRVVRHRSYCIFCFMCQDQLPAQSQRYV